MTCIVSNPWNILDEDSNQVILEIVLSPLKPRNMENWKPNIMLVKQCHNMSEASHMEWWFCLSHSNKNGDSAIRDAGSYSNKTTNPRVNRSTFSGHVVPLWFFCRVCGALFFTYPPVSSKMASWKSSIDGRFFQRQKPHIEEGKNHMPKLSHIAWSWLIWLINQSLFTFLEQETMTLIQKLWGVPFNISVEPDLGL